MKKDIYLFNLPPLAKRMKLGQIHNLEVKNFTTLRVKSIPWKMSGRIVEHTSSVGWAFLRLQQRHISLRDRYPAEVQFVRWKSTLYGSITPISNGNEHRITGLTLLGPRRVKYGPNYFGTSFCSHWRIYIVKFWTRPSSRSNFPHFRAVF